MSKRCPHCDGEIMPSVVKCRHCGRNVKEAPESAPAAAPGVAFVPGQGAPVSPPPTVMSPGDAPEGAAAPPVVPPPVHPAGAPSPAGATPAAAGPPLAGSEAENTKVAIEDPPPPAGISFTPAVAAVATAASPAPPAAMSPPASTLPATAGAPPASPAEVQEWGPPSAEAAKLEPYWQVKAAPAAPAAGIPPVLGAPPVQGTPVKPPKGSAGMLGNIAALFAFLGGAVAVYASMQAWVVLEVSGTKVVEDVTEPIKGTLGWGGKLTLALGVICVVSSVLAFYRKDAGPLKGMIVPGLGILAVVGYTLSTLTTQFTDGPVAELMIQGMSEEAARGQVTTWLDAGAITLTTESSLYLLAGAGSVVLVGAILAFLARKPASRSAAGIAPGF